MKKHMLGILIVVIGCIIVLFYGRSVVQSVTGVENPDQALELNPQMGVQYSTVSTNYFYNELCTVTDIEEYSEIIVKVRVLEDRSMSLRSTRSAVSVEEIYKDLNDELVEGDTIYVVEPVSFLRGDEFYTHGWIYIQTGEEYILFLKHLECVEGYTYTKEEKISYMPVSELFARYDVTGTEQVELLQNAENILYNDIQEYAVLTEDEKKLNLYNQMREQVYEEYLK